MTAKARQTRQEIVAAKDAVDDEWVPASLLDEIEGLDRENFVYKWARKDPQRIRALQQEGWSYVNEADGDRISHRRPRASALEDGEQISSTTEMRELVMMKLPATRAEARRRYFQRKTDRMTEQVTREAQQAAVASGGQIDPQIRIQTGNSEPTVIE